MDHKARVNLKAERREPFHGRWECGCAVCLERQQLHQAAATHPAFLVRMTAHSLRMAMDRVQQGIYGGVAVEDLFD
jgi:hypothetical protein